MLNPALKFLVTAIVAFISMSGTMAQEEEIWTLDKCIAHALEHNSSIKIAHNQYRKAEYDHAQGLWSLAPSINGWSNGNLDLQRSTNQNNQIESGTSYNIGYGLSSSLNLFAGFTQQNTIAARKLYKSVVNETTRLTEMMIELDIISLYAQALYQKSLLAIAEEQLETNKLEAERVAALIEAGRIEPVLQHEINALVSSSQLSVNKMANEYQILKLRLLQLAEITADTNIELSDAGFEAAIPKEVNLSVDSVFTESLGHHPNLRQKELELAYQKKLLQVYKGNLSPSLSLSAGYSSSFFSTDTLSTGKSTPFSTQFNNYRNPYVGLSLNIPLFNGRQRDFQIKKGRLDVENAELYLGQQKKTFRKEVEEMVLKFEALAIEYQSASENLSFTQKSFDAYQQRYQLGLLTTIDFLSSQNQLAQAQSNLLMVRYSWVVQKRTLEIYWGRLGMGK
jgi:outer membrane protein